jgi:hypothetical protein
MRLTRLELQLDAVFPEAAERQIAEALRSGDGTSQNPADFLLHGNAVLRRPNPEALVKGVIDFSYAQAGHSTQSFLSSLSAMGGDDSK